MNRDTLSEENWYVPETLKRDEDFLRSMAHVSACSRKACARFERIADRIALLTADPEPCEDARKVFESWADDTFYLEKNDSVAYTHHSTKKAWEAFSLATQTADKRVEELLGVLSDIVAVMERFEESEDEDSASACFFKARMCGDSFWIPLNRAKEALAATEPKP